MICDICKDSLDPGNAYQRVCGWEQPGRGAGGRSGSSLVLRERQQEWACQKCITRLRAGFGAEPWPGQERLL